MRAGSVTMGIVLRYVWLIWLLASAGLVWALAQGGIEALHVVLGLGLLFVAFWLSPLYGGLSRKHADVMRLPADERRFVVYWQPADIFSTRLRGGLGRYAKGAIWINVWQDREAEAFARERGEGMLPVVILDGETLVNPDPRTLIDRLR